MATIFIGIISDTHGLLRQEVREAFFGASLIIHAGDVGSVSVLDGLRSIAPVKAVRGNMDGGPLGASLSATEVIELQGKMFYVLHDLSRLDIDPRAGGMTMVVFGHTHLPTFYEERGVVFLNPGSAGPLRPGLPTGIARVHFEDDGDLRVQMMKLK